MEANINKVATIKRWQMKAANLKDGNARLSKDTIF